MSGLAAARCGEEIGKLIMVFPALCIPDHARILAFHGLRMKMFLTVLRRSAAAAKAKSKRCIAPFGKILAEVLRIRIISRKTMADNDGGIALIRTKIHGQIGGRPSSIIVGEQLTPEALGALLSHFENKVMYQGFVWNINSFDQEGVQLGAANQQTASIACK